MIAAALKESKKSECRSQHGAIITRGGSVLGKGSNTYKTHPTWGGGPLKTLHAEAAAIRDAVRQGINVRGATIYVVRGGERMSKPCPSCKKFIMQYGISKVVYTDGEGNIVTEYPLNDLLS